MRIRWKPAACADLRQISDCLRAPPGVTAPCINLMRVFAQSNSGRAAGRDASKAHEKFSFRMPHIAVYRLKEEIIEVLPIYPGAQGRSQLSSYAAQCAINSLISSERGIAIRSKSVDIGAAASHK